MSNVFTLIDEPLIEYVIDQTDGKEYGAGEYIAASAREISEIRVRVYDARQRNEPNIICSACHRPAYPRKNVKTGKFHFAHVSESDNQDWGCKPKPAKISDCSQLGVPRPNRRNLPIVLTGNTCFPTSTLRLQNKTPKSHKKCTGNYVAMLWCTKI